ncbi:ricin B lectin domain-containing protein [Biscogniauxia mediterranea]|nr:ricin B lectin domain-containing protein [Biscogniauxia mediterranea]
MISSPLTLSLALALGAATTAAGGLAQPQPPQPPEGYQQVTIATAWSAQYVLQPAAPAQAGSGVVIMSASGGPEQQWYLREEEGKSTSTRIQLAETELCLDAGTGRSNGSPLTVADCVEGQASQAWLYNADSQIVLDQTGAQLCADLYMGAVQDNTRVVIWQCIAGDKNHIWNVANVSTTATQ